MQAFTQSRNTADDIRLLFNLTPNSEYINSHDMVKLIYDRYGIAVSRNRIHGTYQNLCKAGLVLSHKRYGYMRVAPTGTDIISALANHARKANKRLRFSSASKKPALREGPSAEQKFFNITLPSSSPEAAVDKIVDLLRQYPGANRVRVRVKGQAYVICPLTVDTMNRDFQERLRAILKSQWDLVKAPAAEGQVKAPRDSYMAEITVKVHGETFTFYSGQFLLAGKTESGSFSISEGTALKAIFARSRWEAIKEAFKKTF